MTDRPPAPPRTRSGEHPAVSVYRDKLDSIVDNEAEGIDALNRALEQYVNESVPPPAETCPQCSCPIDFFNMDCPACVERAESQAAESVH
ncbi:MAG: hypothetical protein KGL39_35950 [Patescibacteria group bacterium]|nr:hypothetical protein [Patescibacteria group bacterium]